MNLPPDPPRKKEYKEEITQKVSEHCDKTQKVIHLNMSSSDAAELLKRSLVGKSKFTSPKVLLQERKRK